MKKEREKNQQAQVVCLEKSENALLTLGINLQEVLA